MIQAADIEQMGVEEQLQAVELLWASLVRRPNAVLSPEWHGNVLAVRMAAIERGEGEFPSKAQLKEPFRKPPS